MYKHEVHTGMVQWWHCRDTFKAHFVANIKSLHAEIVSMSVIINAEINVICLGVKVSSIA